MCMRMHMHDISAYINVEYTWKIDCLPQSRSILQSTELQGFPTTRNHENQTRSCWTFGVISQIDPSKDFGHKWLTECKYKHDLKQNMIKINLLTFRLV